MGFDVARVRGLIPALGDGWIHLDATAGMQAPEQVVSAITTALRAPGSVPGGPFAASGLAAEVEDAARRAVADLVGGDPRGVVLGPNRAALLSRLADAVGQTWTLGDEIIVSRLDDVANVAPWVRNAQRRGAAVLRAEIDLVSCELPAWQFDELLDGTTRVVALTAASGEVGTGVDVAAVAERTQVGGALLVVDVAAAAAYGPVDLGDLGADVLALDAAAWGGPQVGALVFRVPALLDRLVSCSLDPAARGPHRLELGPLPSPQLAGLTASIEHLADLDDTASGSRGERIRASMTAVRSHQAELLEELLDDLRDTAVTVLARPPRRVPQLSFTHPATASAVAEHLARRGICAFADPGERGVLAHLGVGEAGGVVRIGLAHYTTRAETGALVAALTELD